MGFYLHCIASHHIFTLKEYCDMEQQEASKKQDLQMPAPILEYCDMEQQEASKKQDLQMLDLQRSELFAKHDVTGFELKISSSDANILHAMNLLAIMFVVGCITYYFVNKDCTTNSGQQLKRGQKVQVQG